MIGDHPVVRREREFAATSQSQSGNRHRYGLAGHFELAQAMAQTKEMIERDTIAFAGRRRHDHVIGRLQLGQISTRAEARRLAGTDDDARHIALLEPVRKQVELFDRCIREHVHRAARHVEDEVQDVIWRQFDAKLLQLRSERHRSLSVPITVYSCTIVLA
jgi:hypothetical protein